MRRMRHSERHIISNRGGGWDIGSGAEGRVTGHASTRHDAIEHARQTLQSRGGGKLLVHRRDDSILRVIMVPAGKWGTFRAVRFVAMSGLCPILFGWSVCIWAAFMGLDPHVAKPSEAVVVSLVGGLGMLLYRDELSRERFDYLMGVSLYLALVMSTIALAILSVPAVATWFGSFAGLFACSIAVFRCSKPSPSWFRA